MEYWPCCALLPGSLPVRSCPPAHQPASPLDICREGHTRQQPDFKRDLAASHAAHSSLLALYEDCSRAQVIPREPTTTEAAEAPARPLEARIYQVLIPLSLIYFAATMIPGSPFNNGGAPSA